MERPAKKNLLKSKSGEDPPVTPYNAEFWRSYDLIKEFPITDQILNDLGEEVDVETQFAQRATDNKKP